MVTNTSPPFTVSAEEFDAFETDVASGDARPTPSMKAAMDEHQRLARTRSQPSELRRLAELAKAAAAAERVYPPCDWHERAAATAAYIALGMQFDAILELERKAANAR